MAPSRSKIVKTLASWEGYNESDGSYKKIIDIYNSQPNLSSWSKMQYSWPWCACTASAAFIANGYTSKDAPIEISCPRMIDLAKKCTTGAYEWIEDESVTPEIGWFALYDWEDTGLGDNQGLADHVGIITYVNKAAGYFVVTEGNCSDMVKKRTVLLNGKYLRGFIKINYGDSNNVGARTNAQRTSTLDTETVARQVITGAWGSGEARKKNLEAKGYNYAEVQAKVNEILNGSAATGTKASQKIPTSKVVTAPSYATSFDKRFAKTYTTTADLYVRMDAGTNKKAVCKIPKGGRCTCYGYFSTANGVNWLLVTVPLSGVLYTGFVSSVYLK